MQGVSSQETKVMDYYNDNDAYAAAWIRNLQEDGHLPPGRVDERSIEDVKAQDLEGYRQVHFFAGIGGWPLALRLAGWPEGRPVWTGSCPCQPFSTAGLAKGLGDERHLWPAFCRLISKRRPPIIFGEQVASKDGRYWLAGVRDDLEKLGYAVGAADLCAAGIKAPHLRQRLYWVAYSDSGRSQQRNQEERTVSKPDASGGMGQPVSTGFEGHSGDGDGRHQPGRIEAVQVGSTSEASGVGGMEYTNRAGREPGQQTGKTPRHGDPIESTGCWNDTQVIRDSKGKYRRVPVEPSLFPLAPRVPGRVGLLRGAGGSIVPQVAAEFIRAYLETEVI